jgi:methyl-accepting chemotaxis protein
VTTLNDFRGGVSKLFIGFLWANLAALLILLVWRQDPGAAMIFGLGLMLCLASSIAAFRNRTAFQTRFLTSISAVSFAALFLLAARGSNLILDMHMYFYAALAISAAWCCWRSLLICAFFVALHHLILDYLYPTAVFPEASNLGRVVLHAGIVAVEVAVLSLLSQRLATAFRDADSAFKEIASAREEAVKLAEHQRQIAARETRSQNALLVELARFGSQVASHMSALRQAGEGLREAGGVLKQAVAQSTTSTASAAAASLESADAVGLIESTTSELAVAIGEIERRMTETSALVSDSAQKACVTERQANELLQSIDRVAQFAATIQSVATRTNLLALNATIEAARAGDAGRGFAVVAGEVKSLAASTAKATKDIQSQVAEIRAIAASTGQSVGEVATAAAGIDTHASAVADALRQQLAATTEIARVMHGVASSTSLMKDSVSRANSSAGKTAELAAVADNSSRAVLNVADHLQDEMERFLADVRISQRLSA